MKLKYISPFVFMLHAVACVPVTKYVRTANIASAKGETLTLPVYKDVEISGNVAFNNAGLGYPHRQQRLGFFLAGDPLLNESYLAVGGLARFKIHENIVVGAEGTVDFFESRNILGFPFDSRVAWQVGPNIAFHFHPESEKLTLGFSVATVLASMPWNSFERTTQNSYTYRTLAFDTLQYRQTEHSWDFLFLFRVSAGVSYLLEEHVEFFGGLSWQNSAKNIGFDNYQHNGSTLSASVMNLVPYFGVGGRLEQFFARVQVYMPFALSDYDRVLFGTQLQIGCEI